MIVMRKKAANPAFFDAGARMAAGFDVAGAFAWGNESRTRDDNSQRWLDVVGRWVYPIGAVGTGEAIRRFVVVFECAGCSIELQAASELHGKVGQDAAGR